MVKIALKISLTAENINSLSTCGPNFEWNLKLKCSSCNETDEKWHAINENEKIEGKKGHTTVNYQMKCKFCSSTSTLDVVKDSIKPISVSENGMVKEQTIVVFDCRGVEPVEFDPRSGWIARNEDTNTVFSDVDFTEDQASWVGFDEKGSVPVNIDEFTCKFVRS